MNLTFVKIMERKTICQRKTLRVPFLVPWGESFVFRGAGAGSPYAWPGGRGDRSVLPLYKACRFARFFNFIDVFFRSRLAPRQHRRPGVLLHATSYHKAC